ncbi:sigma-70 family RNA polymerase sigma factor [Actinacidiphila oryziradicis]|jgi:RNA polymerase sigma-70 factor (ECF subfamily)|uniref:RNA polymerase sigma factor n=1 Tax=Actinacidiphila oryziradicis TaxID=2571141 RepID=A0A4U0SK65_9ACTN|nr:sigma-70 family RNA polymerase sigma factor [Actinacidiphila oryziradicis]MCW2873430.1 polymerase sigma factor SigL [Actinacidiphila oryziradicis]TKA10204.1 sigma-70 family RNA polymerase sigma factor [Actinacidiphila oryziradicis]
MGREALHRLDSGGAVRQDAAVAEHAGRVPEEDLMRALYREHSGALFAYVLRLVGGDRYLAEDIVQETLLRAWKSASRLDPAARSLRPWLVTVARRLVIDGHRSRLARPPEASPAALDQLPAEDELDRSLRLMTISDALEDLTDAHRQVLIETYFKGRTVNEAAAELGVPPGTVRSRVFYALRSLKIALEERGVTTS